MKISALIPTYNSAKTINKTLDSILQQTRRADEILILDDGSTDNTIEILNYYKPSVTVIQRENRGVASARNELCALATGDLIAFLDHDDIWHRQYLAAQHARFLKYPSAAGFFAARVDFYGYGNYEFTDDCVDLDKDLELIQPAEF